MNAIEQSLSHGNPCGCRCSVNAYNNSLEFGDETELLWDKMSFAREVTHFSARAEYSAFFEIVKNDIRNIL